MSYDESDALYEQAMDSLYEDFKQRYEDEFIVEGVGKFYKINPEVVKASLQNLSESKTLFESQFHTSAFLHAIISIEVGIKLVALKPILYSLAIDNSAGDLLYDQTFKQKSLEYIPKIYYQILEDFTQLNFKTKHRSCAESTIWNEWKELQKLRNKVVHQGISVEQADAEKSINMASYVCEEIIPIVLDRFFYHIENGVIQFGSREHILNRERALRKTQSEVE